MRYFLDAEFEDTGTSIDPISIALVREDGKNYYAEFAEYDWRRPLNPTRDWLHENVRPKLDGSRLLPRDQIAAHIVRFIGDDKPEFWGYYCAYDWVLFCQLFGRMLDLPKGWPYRCRDLKDLMVGDLKFPEPVDHKHYALADARWIARTYFELRPRFSKTYSLTVSWDDEANTYLASGHNPVGLVTTHHDWPLLWSRIGNLVPALTIRDANEIRGK